MAVKTKKTNKAAKPAKVAKASKTVVAKADAPKKTKKAEAPAIKLTKVVAKFDAGWGNMLFIRGNGAGLDWERGVPMQCIGEDEWMWKQLTSADFVTFKILINDQVWSVGDDMVVAGGDSIVCHPKF